MYPKGYVLLAGVPASILFTLVMGIIGLGFVIWKLQRCWPIPGYAGCRISAAVQRGGRRF